MDRIQFTQPKIWVKRAHAYTADTRLSSSSPRVLLESLGTRLCPRLALNLGDGNSGVPL